MKSKAVGLLVLVLHIAALAGFSLMQGCTTGECPIPWLNWPYSAPPEEPLMFPADELEAPMLPPVDIDEGPGLSGAPYGGDVQTYTVRKGDTLSAIASRYGIRWKELAAFNHLDNPNRLRVGQEIQIPGGAGLPAPAAPAPSRSSAPVAPGSTYEIQKGDTLSGIARRSGVTVAELKAANGMTGSRIIAGRSLVIPSGGTVPEARPERPEPARTVSDQPEPAPLAGLDEEPAPAVPEAAPEPEPAAAAPVYTHVLYPGETLDDVARQHGSSRSEIMSLNNISDPDNVKPGTKLLIPMPE